MLKESKRQLEVISTNEDEHGPFLILEVRVGDDKTRIRWGLDPFTYADLQNCLRRCNALAQGDIPETAHIRLTFDCTFSFERRCFVTRVVDTCDGEERDGFFLCSKLFAGNLRWLEQATIAELLAQTVEESPAPVPARELTAKPVRVRRGFVWKAVVPVVVSVLLVVVVIHGLPTAGDASTKMNVLSPAPRASSDNQTTVVTGGANTVTPTVGKGPTNTLPASTAVSAPVYYQNQVIALMYHDVETGNLPGDVITPATFGQELALLQKENFHVVSLQQVIDFLQGAAPLPDNAVLITFDNGYESFYQTVYPMLKAYHDPAVLFMIVHWLSPPHKKGLFTSLNWAQVEEMYHSGLVAVEPQTYNLHHAAQVGPHATSPATVARIYDSTTGHIESLSAYDARVYADVKRARVELANVLHEPNVNVTCYPFGDYNPAFVHVLERAGYKYMFTASFGWGIVQQTNHTTLYRIDAGSPYFTADGLMSTITQIANETTQNPTWHAPDKYVQVWNY